ncbi:glycosyltransferase family 2 protein [Paenibacillus sp. HN-1]|uniref:glycosyltransferase family 2 protein n=1 Tax=Paenibacillus TaxID=44249 RepID=UPI001CAA1BCD|nr:MULTISPECIES: glycosyltransferase family 2 protein [Paenibacillus]MBY9080354.1 glycosyltransferase family 2 protein [Paenibacillus sp. CGMCC 1.18879]MBY9082987.1 glycosyltransferase family 2 protein [Paenibacillus sinensis]
MEQRVERMQACRQFLTGAAREAGEAAGQPGKRDWNARLQALIGDEQSGVQEEMTALAKVVARQADGRDAPEVLRFYLDRRFGLGESDEAQILEGRLADLRSSLTPVPADGGLPDGEAASKVSVIITTYNRKAFLRQAIESILAQDYPHKEVTVIDDASTDGTDEMMEEAFGGESRVIYMRNKSNRGPGANRLEAFTAHGDGEYILFLDDDDYLIDPGYFSRAVAFHKRVPGLSFVAANVFLEYSASGRLQLQEIGLAEVTDRRSYFLNFERPGYGKPASTLTTIFRREALLDMDIFQMNMVNDASIYLRSLLVGDAGFIDSTAGVYRIHGNNITFNLTRDFLVRNLEEKRMIRNLAVDRYSYRSSEMTGWFNNTAYDTIVYYLRNSAKTTDDYTYMYAWTRSNCPDIYGKIKQEFRGRLMKKQILRFPLVRKLIGR